MGNNQAKKEISCSVSLIPDSKDSQYKGSYAVEGNASSCTYNAIMAVGILDDLDIQSPDIVWKQVWNDILFTGKSAFESNHDKMEDPYDLDQGVKLEDTLICHNKPGYFNERECKNRIKRCKYALFNSGGETILIYNIKNGVYLLVDTHKSNGLHIIQDIDSWLLKNIYEKYKDADTTVPTVNFSKRQQ